VLLLRLEWDAIRLLLSHDEVTFAQVNIRGWNLAYVEDVEFLFHGQPSTSGADPVPDEGCTLAAGGGAAPGAWAWVCSPTSQLNTRLTARCEGHFGLLRGAVEVRLRGSCFRTVGRECHSDQWRPFRALSGHRKRFESMPVAALLERIFAHRELATSCRLVCRGRGGLRLHGDVGLAGSFCTAALAARLASMLPYPLVTGRGEQAAKAGAGLISSVESILGEARVHACVHERIFRLRSQMRLLDWEGSMTGKGPEPTSIMTGGTQQFHYCPTEVF
jgi:hypothetical protein